MKDAQPQAILLTEYRPPAFLIEQTELYIDLHEDYVEVRSRLAVVRNPAPDAAAGEDLVLNGVDLSLESLCLDGEALAPGRYRLGAEELVISDVPERFTLECVTRCRPRQNKSLEGLYSSRKMFCTQCEAEGFRKITYYPDRPDVLSRFTTTIEADKAEYPVLLSNGNCVSAEDLEQGRHRLVWEDPFAKPCYLFALVAGDLQFVQDSYTTGSGRLIDLRLYVEEKDLDKCAHAISSLKCAMRWDEAIYGLEYDLDIYMIVAVDDFNMGAMENKGLNIFNTSCVLANPTITTDAGFQRIEGIIAHEYFHNWSGNRVTCRDWFQLSLKEGFTVFRDACFSADTNSATVKRVEDVKLLRTSQFAEDAGPTAHSIRPDSYIEISNFYTVTVYEKGAEVVGMLHTLLGPELFRRGADLYFRRHDGQAATCEQFIAAMAEASGRDLDQFSRWYSQVGTPVLRVSDSFDAGTGVYTLRMEQACPRGPKLPLQIPVRLGLLGRDGPLPMRRVDAPTVPASEELVLELTEPAHEYSFDGLREKPVPSLLRGFSAPLKLEYDYSTDDLRFIMTSDSDGFNRWDAGQKLAMSMLQEMTAAYRGGRELRSDPALIEALRQLLTTAADDKSMLALMLQLPSEAYLSEEAAIIDVVAIHEAREAARRDIARQLESELLLVYRANGEVEDYRPEIGQIARRSLRNQCLNYLSATGQSTAIALCEEQLGSANNMTDRLAALQCLINIDQPEAVAQGEAALAEFYRNWQHEPLAVNLWFQLQAATVRPGALDRVIKLMAHPSFDRYNPNKVRAVIGVFCNANPVNFHDSSGAGYEFLAGQVAELDGSNPQLAARLLTPLTRWRKYPDANAVSMQGVLQDLAARDGLSRDVYEIVSRSLDG